MVAATRTETAEKQAALFDAFDRVKHAREELAAAELDLWNEIDAQFTDRHADPEEVVKGLLTGKSRLVGFQYHLVR